jgi:hypothetical protein
MADLKKEFDRLFEWLTDSEKEQVLDYMKNLIGDPWERIAQREPDTVPLSEEERAQLEAPDKEYISLEEAKRELGLENVALERKETVADISLAQVIQDNQLDVDRIVKFVDEVEKED